MKYHYISAGANHQSTLASELWNMRTRLLKRGEKTFQFSARVLKSLRVMQGEAIGLKKDQFHHDKSRTMWQWWNFNLNHLFQGRWQSRRPFPWEYLVPCRYLSLLLSRQELNDVVLTYAMLMGSWRQLRSWHKQLSHFCYWGKTHVSFQMISNWVAGKS